MIRVPTQQQVALIGIDTSQQSVDPGIMQFMFESVGSKRCMVCLDVQLEMLLQPIFEQERMDRSRIKVILVLRWLFGLRLNQELPRKPDFLRIVHSHVQETGKIVQFQLHVGVEQSLIAFPPAPKHIVFAAEFLVTSRAFFTRAAA